MLLAETPHYAEQSPENIAALIVAAHVIVGIVLVVEYIIRKDAA